MLLVCLDASVLYILQNPLRYFGKYPKHVLFFSSLHFLLVFTITTHYPKIPDDLQQLKKQRVWEKERERPSYLNYMETEDMCKEWKVIHFSFTFETLIFTQLPYEISYTSKSVALRFEENVQTNGKAWKRKCV